MGAEVPGCARSQWDPAGAGGQTLAGFSCVQLAPKNKSEAVTNTPRIPGQSKCNPFLGKPTIPAFSEPGARRRAPGIRLFSPNPKIFRGERLETAQPNSLHAEHSEPAPRIPP